MISTTHVEVTVSTRTRIKRRTTWGIAAAATLVAAAGSILQFQPVTAADPPAEEVVAKYEASDPKVYLVKRGNEFIARATDFSDKNPAEAEDGNKVWLQVRQGREGDWPDVGQPKFADHNAAPGESMETPAYTPDYGQAADTGVAGLWIQACVGNSNLLGPREHCTPEGTGYLIQETQMMQEWQQIAAKLPNDPWADFMSGVFSGAFTAAEETIALTKLTCFPEQVACSPADEQQAGALWQGVKDTVTNPDDALRAMYTELAECATGDATKKGECAGAAVVGALGAKAGEAVKGMLAKDPGLGRANGNGGADQPGTIDPNPSSNVGPVTPQLGFAALKDGTGHDAQLTEYFGVAPDKKALYDSLKATATNGLSHDQRQFVVDTRKSVTIRAGQVLTKILRPEAVAAIFDEAQKSDLRGGIVKGSIARGEDVADLRTHDQFRQGLGLPENVDWNPIKDGVAYQVRWTAAPSAADPAKTTTPFGCVKDVAGLDECTLDMTTILGHEPTRPGETPFTGTGSTSGGIPEWIADTELSERSEIWAIDPTGNERLYALYEGSSRKWHKMK